jgi:hypothetical protein
MAATRTEKRSGEAALEENWSLIRSERLLLPSALLVTIGAELLAPLMLVNLGFASFFQ